MREPDVVEPGDVLLVEDNPGDVRLTREAFQEANIANTLHVVRDGDEALDFLYRRGDYVDAPRPSIVLLDYYLPRTTGAELLREIDGDDELGSIPVVMLTGSEAQVDHVESEVPEPNAWLTKPVNPLQFLETVVGITDSRLTIGRSPSGAGEICRQTERGW